MPDPTDDAPGRPRGPRLAAAAVVGLFVPFVVPLGVLLVAASDRHDMKRGRRPVEPALSYRVAMGLSALALIVQCAALFLVIGVASRYTEEVERSGAVGVVGDPCVVADACCTTLRGEGDPECRALAERAGEIQDTPHSATASSSAESRMVCTEALRAYRGEIASAGRSIPEACGFAPPGGARPAK